MNNTTRKFLLLTFVIFTSLGCNRSWVRKVKQASRDEEQGLTKAETGDSLMVAAGSEYAAGGFHQALWGKSYRDVWTTPVMVKIFDPEAEGYRLTGTGGGRQTLSLKAQDAAGKEKVLRSLDKDPAEPLPKTLQYSILGSVVKDQTSFGNPYGALTLPPMAEAIGVFHTDPKLRYIPYSPKMGKYEEDFGGMLVLSEEKPNGDRSRQAFMGNSKKVVSTHHMIEDILRENDSKVDARHYLRSRMFDMLIGDWSRHEDNWRWASYQQEKGTLYMAIPRDRDHTYYNLDGAMPKAIRVFVKSHLRTFEAEYDGLVKLNASANKLDHLLLAELSKKDWQEIADSIKMELTDEVIDQAMLRFPKEIFALKGEWTAERLKGRRDRLPIAVMDYYYFLSKKPIIYCTDKHEEIVLTSQGNNLLVQINKIDSDGKFRKQLYKRLFLGGETEKITIYGLGGNDNFVLEGNTETAISAKLYGGAGEDTYMDRSVQEPASVKIFDTEQGSKFDVKSSVRVNTLDSPEVKTFDASGAMLDFYIWD